MTAIVGTINRRGVAFAADSAATHTTSSTSKISNTANKIFSLSSKHPVGIALYNNLDFHGLPWEELFKRYRDNHLKNKSFPKLTDYIDDFWKYMYKDILKKISRKDQESHVIINIIGLRDEIISTAQKNITDRKEVIDDKKLFVEMEGILNTLISQFASFSKTSDFKDYKENEFGIFAKDLIDTYIDKLLRNPECPADFRSLFEKAAFQIIISDLNVYYSHSGLIFWGYGEDEFFPSYYEYHVSFAFDGKIKFVKISDYVVSNSNNACVAPFAQTDVANTVVRGIDQALRNEISSTIKVSFESFRNTIIQTLHNAGAPVDLENVLKGIDIEAQTTPVIDHFDKFIKVNYTDRILETVAYLSKEDLAEMAESLVKMTCLKRHITTDAESVGGPVDVAVITKGDGFIWIKRKHYFSPELNHEFFNRK